MKEIKRVYTQEQVDTVLLADALKAALGGTS